MGFFVPERTDAEGISKVILNELKKVIPNDPSKLIGQTYDCAAVMKGNKNGAKVKIQSVYPNAHYVHCYAHQLNLILKRSANSKSSQLFYKHLITISNYFSRSPQKLQILSEFTKLKIARAAPTRWNFTSRLVKTVKENYQAIYDCLKQIDITEN